MSNLPQQTTRVQNPAKTISKMDYQTWRHHPVSQVLLHYLKDYQEVLQREAWDYLKGCLGTQGVQLDEGYLGELVGRAKVAAELSDLPFEAIEAFYEENNEAEAI